MYMPVQQLIRDKLNVYLEKIEEMTNADVIYINHNIFFGLSAFVNQRLIELSKCEKKRDRLFFIITTTGGSAEEVETIVNITRHFYKEVDFAIPEYAYSAGTILCMSGDEIYMSYNGALGPIDPQVQNKDGKFVPAQGYLDTVAEFVAKSKSGDLSDAEYMMLKEIDLADLRRYQQARELSIVLLKKWLVKYKFKNWNKREGSGTNVTEKDKIKRAEEIAAQLSDNNVWKTHQRPIDIHTARNILNLQIRDFEDIPGLKDLIFEYNDLVKDFTTGLLKLGGLCHTRRFL